MPIIFGLVPLLDLNLVARSRMALRQIPARCCVSAMTAAEPRLREQARVWCQPVFPGGGIQFDLTDVKTS
jgi:hypothetical protein